MTVRQEDDDHFEPIPGLPEELPEGERILWQGAPSWKAIAIDVFHVRAVAIYSGLMLAWHFASLLYDGAGLVAALTSVAIFLPLPLVAIGMLLLFAKMTAGTTLYTITTKRVVLRIGIVLTLTVNIPFRIVQAAAKRPSYFGTTGIAMQISGPGRVSYLHLWPHARPWKLSDPEPMMRALPDGERAAEILARALAADLAERAGETGDAVPSAPVRVRPKTAGGHGATGHPVGATG